MLSLQKAGYPTSRATRFFYLFLSVAVTTEYYKQCDDYYPDDVVIVENIAQAVHSCSSVYNFTEKPRLACRAFRWYYMSRRAKMLQRLNQIYIVAVQKRI